MKNTEISEMCFWKLSLPRVRGGEGDEVSDGRRGNERLEKEKERWTDRETDSKRMTERQIARRTKTHYAEEQKAVTKLVQRMTNDATPNWEPEGIRGGSDILYFGSWLSEQKKKKVAKKSFTGRSSYYTSNIHIMWMHILYFYPAEALARPSQAVWHSRGVDVLFRQ